MLDDCLFSLTDHLTLQIETKQKYKNIAEAREAYLVNLTQL